MKVALVHDWLTGMRGGEKVLEVLCERFPDAELFTLLHVRGSVSPAIERLTIHTSALQRLPGVRHYYRECLPLFPTLIEQFDLRRFDLVLSTSHCVAKSALAAPNAVHICYCLTPMRYAWDQFDAYFGPRTAGPASQRRHARWSWTGWRGGTARPPRAQTAMSLSLIMLPGESADTIIARRLWCIRRSTLIFSIPTGEHAPGRYALVVSALVPYKRLDLAIDACRIARVPLKIVGDGPDRGMLERRGGRGPIRNRVRGALHSQVEFLGRRSDDELRELYRGAAVVMLPGEEDFGIVPLEAQACGRPVVAYARGGAIETVVPEETGFLVDDAKSRPPLPTRSSAPSIARFDATVIRRHAERFGRARFGDEIEAVVRETIPSW